MWVVTTYKREVGNLDIIINVTSIYTWVRLRRYNTYIITYVVNLDDFLDHLPKVWITALVFCANKPLKPFWLPQSHPRPLSNSQKMTYQSSPLHHILICTCSLITKFQQLDNGTGATMSSSINIDVKSSRNLQLSSFVCYNNQIRKKILKNLCKKFILKYPVVSLARHVSK